MAGQGWGAARGALQRDSRIFAHRGTIAPWRQCASGLFLTVPEVYGAEQAPSC